MAVEQSRHMVAVLDSVEVTRHIKALCLLENEIEESAAIPNQLRRAERVAGRIAAKYAFLFGERMTQSSSDGALWVRRLNGRDLTAFSSKEYRAVSVIRNQEPGGGPARVGWSRKSDTAPVVISHSNGISCASVGTASVCSIDLETAAPRVPEFYRHTFTRRERDWVGDCSHTSGLDPEWLFTLLWSARECLLKTPHFRSMSLVNMPTLEIVIHDGVERLAAMCRSKDLSESFEFFKATSLHRAVRFAVAGAHNLVLTALTGVNNELDNAA